MAATALDASKVLHGRIKTVDFLASDTSVYGRTGLKDSVIENAKETTPADVTIELDDGTTVYEKGGIYHLEFDIVMPEINSTDVTAIEGADEINLVTSAGGTNGTGVTFSASIDFVRATLDGLKTRIHVVCEHTARPYTITDIAAA